MIDGLEILILLAALLYLDWRNSSYIGKRFDSLEESLRADSNQQEEKIERLNFWFKDQFEEIKDRVSSVKEVVAKAEAEESFSADDELYEDAREAVIRAQGASLSQLQRSLGIGYARAARLLDMLEETCVIGPADAENVHKVLVEK